MALKISSGGSTKKKLTDEERQALGGSVYDQMYFTDDELINADKVRQEARAGNISWGDANKFVNSISNKYGYDRGARGDEFNPLPGYIQPQKIDMPEYNSRYDPAIAESVEKLLSRPAFSYDPENDPRYAAYKKEYAREGQRATADTMGQLAAMTGGMPSTAAVTAAQQAGDYYAAQMADKIPELYQLAYQMYMNEGDEMRANLGLLRGLEGDDWSKYTDQWNMADADRKFDYGVQSDNWNRGHTLDREAEDDRRYQTEWDYKVAQDQKEWDLNTALQAAQYGDYSGLQALGINPDLNAVLNFALASGGRTTPVGSGGSGGGGGSRSSGGGGSSGGGYGDAVGTPTGDAASWDALSVWANTYGENYVKSYLDQHYKEYGFSKAADARDYWEMYKGDTGLKVMNEKERADYLSSLPLDSNVDDGMLRYGREPDISNRHDSNGIWVDGEYIPNSQIASLVNSNILKESYNFDTHTMTYTKVPKNGMGARR